MITEVLGFSLVLPFLPLLAEKLGGNPFQIGLIVASFSLFQFFSAPIMGKISDYVGRRPMLIISQLSTFVSFIILGFANSLWLIVLSRVIDGLFGSNQAIAQAYLSDISSKKDRSRAFGLAGMAFGVGFLVGPATGGFLSKFDYSIPAFLAASICFLTILTTIFMLPETVERKKIDRLSLKIMNFGDFRKYLSNPKLALLIATFAAYVTSLFIFTTNLALFFNRKLDFGASEVGFLLAYVGIVNLVLRGPLLGKFIDMFGEKRLTFTGIVFLVFGFLLMALLGDSILIYVAFTFFAVGSAFSRPLITGEISRQVSEEEQGSIAGVIGSLGSVARIVGPLLGGFILTNFDPRSLVLSSSLVISLGLVAFLVAEINHRRNLRAGAE